MRLGKKMLSILLTLVMVLTFLPTTAIAAQSTESDFMRIFSLDCGRKYFSVNNIKNIIDKLSENNYTHMQLAFGNEGFRFLLDDMSLTVNGTNYSSTTVKNAIHTGNTTYDSQRGYSTSTDELSQADMDEIIAYAKSKKISIIPMFDSPGHTNAILTAVDRLGISNSGQYGSTNSNGGKAMYVTDTYAMEFIRALVTKYAAYFSANGSRYFNIAADECNFSNMNTAIYTAYAQHVNALNAIVKAAGMTTLMYNDGVYHLNMTTNTAFDNDIIICYWDASVSSYAQASTLANTYGFRIINTNNKWYYVAGSESTSWFGYKWALSYMNGSAKDCTVCDGGYVTNAGCMASLWCDTPSATVNYNNVYNYIATLAKNNPSYFVEVSEPHEYAITSTANATCTTAGSVTYTCTDCGDSYTESIPALGHDYAVVEDCGDKIYTCTRCGNTYNELLPRETISLKVGQTSQVYTLEGNKSIETAGNSSIAAANLNITEITGVAVPYRATASASVACYNNYTAANVIDGNASTYYWSSTNQRSGAYVCVDLDANLCFDAIQVTSPKSSDYCSRANVQVSANGSTWTTIGTHTGSSSRVVTNTYTVPTSVGNFRYIRVVLTAARSYWWQLAEIAWGSYNGGTFTRAATSGTVYTGSEPSTELSFTGVSGGTTAYVVDGVKYVIEVEEDHTHAYTSVITTNPTCTAAGVKTYTCSVCGDTYTESIPATGHNYSSIVTAPTCTETGYTTYTCANCQHSYTANPIAALGHDYSSRVTKAATCEENGVKTYTCANCHDSYTESIPAIGHNYVVTVGDATCTEGGTLTYTCSNCDDAYTETTEALGHDYNAVVTAPTCTQAGYTTYTCANCDDSYVANEVAALGHDYNAVVTAPTCTEAGYTTCTCAACGQHYMTDIVPAPGHDYDTMVIAPTCTRMGYTVYTCKACGESHMGDEVAALGHDYEAVVTAPTCTEAGYTTYTCTVCDHSYVADEIAALGHDYEAVVTAPTCTEAGYTTYTCATCDHSYVANEVAALGHSYACVESGDLLVYTCDNCGDTYTEEAMPSVAVNLTVGESHTIHTNTAAITQSADSAIADVSVNALPGGYRAVTSLSDGQYLLVCNGSVLTSTATSYNSSWDGVGYISGLTCTNFSANDSYDNYLWTITAVSGGYTVQSSNGKYLKLTSSSKSAPITLSTTPQVLTIRDLGNTFTIGYQSVYLDRYTNAFVACYPGGANENEVWTLYKAEDNGYDVTIAGVSNGSTFMVMDGTRYNINVHAHDYVSTVTTAPTCTANGVKTFACDCGDTYTESIPATGHNYTCTETDDAYVYTCTNCGHSYAEPIVRTTYDSVSSISSGNAYVITVYASGTYYALTHSGTTLGITPVTVMNGQITSTVTDNMLWNYNSNKFSFTSGSTTYYLYRASSSSWFSTTYTLKISTSGTNATFSNSRLSFSNYYLRYSSGSLSLSRSSYSTCYMFKQNG